LSANGYLQLSELPVTGEAEDQFADFSLSGCVGVGGYIEASAD
jgi:hypothetical protein